MKKFFVAVRDGVLAQLESVVLFLVGVLVFLLGRYVADGSVARTTLQIAGGVASLLAPVLGRIEGVLSISKEGVQIPLGKRSVRARALLSTALADDENLPVVIAAANASHEALAGIINLLRNDIGSAELTVPESFAGLSLINDELQFIRKELGVSIVAIRRPNDRWIFGGDVSETKWAAGMRIVACGPPEGLHELATRIKESATSSRSSDPESESMSPTLEEPD